MDFLPQDLENVIIDYKKSVEDYEECIKRIQIVIQNITADIFTHNLNGKYTDEFTNVCQLINDGLTFKMSQEEIFKRIITSGNIDPNIFDWYNVGGGINNYSKIEDLPRDFVEQFKDNIFWDLVGGGRDYYDYTNIEDLPRDFVEQFKDKIYWCIVGSGFRRNNYGYTKIEDLPRDFVEQFKDKIYWSNVGSGINDVFNFTKIERLPRDFVEQFKDYIKYLKN